MIIEAYIQCILASCKIIIFEMASKMTTRKKNNSIISSLFVYYFFEIDTKYHMSHLINKQMLSIYFKKLRALNYLIS